jgi:zinc transporter ZupT
MNLTVILLATLLGWALHRVLSRKSNTLKLLLAFSGAFVFGILFMHLLPEVFEAGATAGIWFLLGFVLQQGMEHFSRGLEHGHDHNHSHTLWPAVISLFLHAFLEAIPLGLEHHHHGLESALAGAIAVHKIPVAVVYFTFLAKANPPRTSYIIAALLFILAPVLGILLPTNLVVSEAAIVPLTGISGGILLHISTTILYESSADHRFNRQKALITLLGLALAAGSAVL